MKQNTAPVAMTALLPRLSRNEATARNMIAQRARDRVVSFGQMHGTVSLEPWPPSAQLAPSGNHDWLIFAQCAGAPFELQLPASTCGTLIAGRFPDTDVPALPDELAALLLEECLEAVASSVQTLQRGPARIESIQRGGSSPKLLEHGFGLSFQVDEQSIHGHLRTDTLGMMLLAGLLTGLPERLNQLQTDTLPVSLRIELGQSWLASGLLGTLMAGDALVIQEAWISQSHELRLTHGKLGMRVQWNDLGLTVTQALTSTENSMSTPPDAPASSPSMPLTPQDIPVRLSFELGERTLSLQELQQLQVGQVIDLDKPLAACVQVRANGVLIGSGELVQINDRLAVILGSVLSHDEAGHR